jgi:hypothetical protein
MTASGVEEAEIQTGEPQELKKEEKEEEKKKKMMMKK